MAFTILRGVQDCQGFPSSPVPILITVTMESEDMEGQPVVILDIYCVDEVHLAHYISHHDLLHVLPVYNICIIVCMVICALPVLYVTFRFLSHS